jgi:hypothetical protein
MRSTTIITTALAAAIAIGASAGATAKPAKATKLNCTLELYAQGAPNPSGIHFGVPTCPAPFGKGLHYNSYTVTLTSPGHGTIASRFRNYYADGTVRGTAAMTFVASSPTNISYSGTVTYTGGTAAFRHAKGTGTINCTTTDGGAHKACKVSSTLTGI